MLSHRFQRQRPRVSPAPCAVKYLHHLQKSYNLLNTIQIGISAKLTQKGFNPKRVIGGCGFCFFSTPFRVTVISRHSLRVLLYAQQPNQPEAGRRPPNHKENTIGAAMKDMTERQFEAAMERHGMSWLEMMGYVRVTKSTSVSVLNVGTNASRRSQLAYLLKQQEQAQTREEIESKARATVKVKNELLEAK